MAGYQEDPNQWRLRTLTGNIPYKVVRTEGSFDYDAGSVTFTVIIPSARLTDFLEFIFPPPTKVGFFEYPTATALPGLPNLVATSFNFKSLDDGKPIDPFAFDTGAPALTYFELIQLDVKYDTKPKRKNPDPTRPETFLEISANATGEFIHTTMPRAKWQNITNPNVDTDGDNKPNIAEIEGADPETVEGPEDFMIGFVTREVTGERVRGAQEDLGDEDSKDPTVPVMITVPTTEWSAQWPQISYQFFNEVLIHRLRAMMGKINSKTVKWIHGAEPETLLFVGYSLEERNTWRDGLLDKPAISLTMKFVEKRIIWDGVIRGHNDVWRPGVGWRKLKIQENEDVNQFIYQSWDFDRMFKQD